MQVFTGAAVLADIMREQPQFWIRCALCSGQQPMGGVRQGAR